MERHDLALKILSSGTVIPAMPLALDKNRKLDQRRQRALVRYYLDAGAGGLAVGVHTTQFAIRDPAIALLEPLLALVKEEVKRFEKKSGKVIVCVAGACGETTQAVGEAHLAIKHSYDAVLLSPGGLSHLGEEEMLKRTLAVAELIPVMGFYLQPSVGGRFLSFDFWSKLVEIPNIVAIKTAPFNRYMTLDVVRAVACSSRPDKISLYTGNDDNIIIDLITEYSFGNVRKSFAGGLLGHWSVWTKRAVEQLEAAKSGKNTHELLKLANEVTDSNAAFFDSANGFKGCIAGLHEVLRRQGLFKGIWCLDPTETLSPGQMEEIDRVYKAYPHLNDDDFVKENLDIWLA